MEYPTKSIEINPLYLIGSITLGALGALSVHKFQQSRKPAFIHNNQAQEYQKDKEHVIGSPILAKIVFDRLLIRDAQDNCLIQELLNLENITCEIERIPNLLYDLKLKELPLIVNPMFGNTNYRSVYGGEGFLPNSAFVNSDCFILQTAAFGPNDLLSRTKRWLRAGPRKNLFFAPDQVNAAVVVVGGVCPGLNVLVRELTMCFHFNYKMKNLIGFMNGFNGIYNDEWVQLTPQVVKTIHHSGGCFIGTARSAFDPELILSQLKKKNINQLFVVGGLGTMKCIQILYTMIKERGLKIAIIAIPKSIENEIPIIDKSFGFETAVEQSQNALLSAYSECHSRQNSVGIVRLFGTNCGFLAMHASLAFRSVNICLVPEFEFDLYGPRGILEYVYQRLKLKGTCLIVTAEGTVNTIRDCQISQKGKDASGNVKLGNIGQRLKSEILSYCRSKGMTSEVKFIDPLYMVRSVKSNSIDTKLCCQLAQNAIHAAMAGYTGFVAGHASNKTCLIPIQEINSGNYANRIQSSNTEWQRLLAGTGQPTFVNDEQHLLDIQI